MVEFIALMLLVISLLVVGAEIYYERDWPRDTWSYPVIFGLGLFLWIFIYG
jgi:hypothetical protein